MKKDKMRWDAKIKYASSQKAMWRIAEIQVIAVKSVLEVNLLFLKVGQ